MLPLFNSYDRNTVKLAMLIISPNLLTTIKISNDENELTITNYDGFLRI